MSRHTGPHSIAVIQLLSTCHLACGLDWYHISVDKECATFPSPWPGMLACAAIMTVGFIGSALIARTFLPPPSRGAATQTEFVLLP